MFVKTGKKIPAFGAFPETELVLRDYMDGHMALTGHAGEEEWFVATVNIGHFQSGHARGVGEVWLKGWSENAGVPEALVKAGVVRLLENEAQAGYGNAKLALVSDDIVTMFANSRQAEFERRLTRILEESHESDDEQEEGQGQS